jgi:hypothetical protein
MKVRTATFSAPMDVRPKRWQVTADVRGSVSVVVPGRQRYWSLKPGTSPAASSREPSGPRCVGVGAALVGAEEGLAGAADVAAGVLGALLFAGALVLAAGEDAGVEAVEAAPLDAGAAVCLVASSPHPAAVARQTATRARGRATARFNIRVPPCQRGAAPA